MPTIRLTSFVVRLLQARREIDFVSAEREVESVLATALQRLLRIQVPGRLRPDDSPVPPSFPSLPSLTLSCSCACPQVQNRTARISSSRLVEAARSRDALAIHRLPVPTLGGGDEVRATSREKTEVAALRSHVRKRVQYARKMQAQLSDGLLCAPRCDKVFA